jgi:hypothetical protein
MPGSTYYVDPQEGDDTHAGLSTDEPFRTTAGRAFTAGDTILFKRGSVCRGGLDACDGTEEGRITYGAYGEGDKPLFLGSVPVGEAGKWAEERPCLWRYAGGFETEVCNLVFDGGQSCARLRWAVDDLQRQGEWYYTAVGAGSHREGQGERPRCEDGVLYLYSEGNPAEAYGEIECVLWGQRRLAGGQRHILLENLQFANSGVHGFHSIRAESVTIRSCEFRCIGGGVWSKERRIRFGNAVEFWDGARDVVVEDCVFEDIYDAAVTHQGGPDSDVPERVHFRNNLFVSCGLSAYECRGPSAREIYFEHNTCVNAGGDFTMQGEPPPRQSEIYPQPINHHVFIWRMDDSGSMGRIFIRNNIFYQAPQGAAIYSIIHPPDEAHLVLDSNCYWQTEGTMLCRMNGENYTPADWARYRAACQQDAHSILADPAFVDVQAGDYGLRPNSPCPNAGRRATAAC